MKALDSIAELVARDGRIHALAAVTAARTGDVQASRSHARRAASAALAHERRSYVTLAGRGFKGCAHAHGRLSDAVMDRDEAKAFGLSAVLLAVASLPNIGLIRA